MEEETPKEKTEEKTEQPLDKVERAEAVAKRNDEFEIRIDEKIAKLNDLRADKILGGDTEAGTTTEKPKEDTPQEYVDKMRKNGWRA